MNFSKQTKTSLKTFEFKASGFSVLAYIYSHTVIDSAVQEPWKTLNSTIVNDLFTLFCVLKPLTGSCSAFANGNELLASREATLPWA